MAKRRLEVIDGGPPGPDSPEVWKRLLTRNKEDRVEGSLHNLCLILENDDAFAGLFWLNESSNQVVLSRDPPWTSGSRDEFIDADSYELAAWMQHPDKYRMAVGDETVLKAVITVARRHRRHPIREYLQGLVWDGVPRVERMFVELFGAEDRVYNLQAAKCFMVSAVARILWVDPKQPNVGAKVDFMLVLEDKQGKKKTTAMEALFSAIWFVETMESPSGNDFFQILLGCWGVEIAEMDSFSKADVTRVKGAITRRVDKYRAPYERVPRSWRRECVFVGTTNESEYLRDPTGGRRFLPVKMLPDGVIDLDRIKALRDQLWAEAVAMFKEGVQWWVLPAEAAEEQEKRYIEDSWEARIAIWLNGSLQSKDPTKLPPYPERCRYGAKLAWTTTDEILLHAIGMEPGKHDRPAQMRVASAMKRMGWDHVRKEWVPDEGKERRWIRPKNDEPSASGSKGVEGDDDCPF